MKYKKELLSIYPIKEKTKDKYYFGITSTYPRLENYDSNENNNNKIDTLQNYHNNDSTSVFFQKYFKKLGYKTLTKRPIQCKNIKKIAKLNLSNINLSNINLDKSILIFTGHSDITSNKIYDNLHIDYDPSEILLKYFKDYNNIPKNILFYNCNGGNKMCFNLNYNIIRNRHIYCFYEQVSRKSGVKQNEFLNKEYKFYKIFLLNEKKGEKVYNHLIGKLKLIEFLNYFII